MAQIFQRSTNTIARVSIYGAVIFIALLGYAVDVVNKTSYVTEVNTARPNPSHSATNTTWGTWSGLPVLPFVRGSVFLGRDACNGDLHDLSFADLDKFLDARTRAREL